MGAETEGLRNQKPLSCEIDVNDSVVDGYSDKKDRQPGKYYKYMD